MMENTTTTGGDKNRAGTQGCPYTITEVRG